MVGCKVSELESILGISRQAIYDKLKQDKYKTYVSKIKGIKVVSPDGVKALKVEYGIKADNQEIKDIQEEICSTLKMNCKENQDFKDNFTEECKDDKEFKLDFKDNQELIKQLKDRIASLEVDKSRLLDLLHSQSQIMKQQNTLIQNEQRITLNNTELLLMEKREALKLRQAQYEHKKDKKRFKGWLNSWLNS